MLLTTPLTVTAGTYFTDGPATGCWEGVGAGALGLVGGVRGPDLRRVLDGRGPGGGPLVARRAHRRAGWDLTFAAPKSLSLVSALADGGALLVEGHRRAVGDALAWMEHHGCPPSPEGDRGLVAARFEHLSSNRGDPHVHTHVVVANLGPGPRGWAAIDAGWWPLLRPLGAVYRRALVARTPSVRWCERPDGMIDLEGVPRAAIEAASTRSRHVTAVVGAWDDPELAHRSARRKVRGSTRTTDPTPGDASWRAAAAAAGLEAPLATALLAPGAGPPTTPVRRPADGVPWGSTAGPVDQPHAPSLPPPEGGGVDLGAALGWLAARTSSWTTLDVVRAVVATHRGGSSPAGLDAEVAVVTAGLTPVAPPAGEGRADGGGRTARPPAPRWTSGAAASADAHLRRLALAPSPLRVAPEVVAAVVAEHALDPAQAASVRAVVGSSERLHLLAGVPGRSTLVAQAAVVAAARACFEEAGWSVGVATSDSGRRRWDALAALPPAGPDGGRLGGTGRPPDVVVVDRADRVTPPQLRALLEAAEGRGARVLLVDGGTLPGQVHPTTSLVAEGRRAGVAPPALDARRPGAGLVVAGRVTAGLGPGDAAASLVERWAAGGAEGSGLAPGGTAALVERWAVGGGEGSAVLVGLGPAEVEHLNEAARARLADLGALAGPSLPAAGRAYQAGDRVMALRSIGAAGAGAVGVVRRVERHGRRMAVEWAAAPGTPGRAGRLDELDRHEARRLGHAYAVTAARARGWEGTALLLGDPATTAALGRGTEVAALVAPVRTATPPGSLERRAAALADGPRRIGAATRALLGTPADRLDAERRALAASLHAGELDGPDLEGGLVRHAATARALGRHRDGQARALDAGRGLRPLRPGPELGSLRPSPDGRAGAERRTNDLGIGR